MTTFAPGQDAGHRMREIEEQVRRAWAAYRTSLDELEGAEYEAAEQRCWQRLQRKLGELAEERRTILERALGSEPGSS